MIVKLLYAFASRLSKIAVHKRAVTTPLCLVSAIVCCSIESAYAIEMTNNQEFMAELTSFLGCLSVLL